MKGATPDRSRRRASWAAAIGGAALLGLVALGSIPAGGQTTYVGLDGAAVPSNGTASGAGAITPAVGAAADTYVAASQGVDGPAASSAYVATSPGGGVEIRSAAAGNPYVGASPSVFTAGVADSYVGLPPTPGLGTPSAPPVGVGPLPGSAAVTVTGNETGDDADGRALAAGRTPSTLLTSRDVISFAVIGVVGLTGFAVLIGRRWWH